jgi:hypothetical protein
MSVEALRRVMSLATQGMDEDLAAAFYELLLATPLHVPMTNGSPNLLRGSSGQLTLPVFLDEAALRRWGGSFTTTRTCSAQRAAELALGAAEVSLVIDPGSSPGEQAVAREGVESLARGTYPGAERYENEVDFVNALAGAARSGSFDRAVVEKARRARLITIGSATLQAQTANGAPVSVEAMELHSVRGPDGASLCVAWPTPGPSYAFMPDSPRMTLPFTTLLRAAAQVRRGIVIDPHRMPIPIPFQQLSKLGAML